MRETRTPVGPRLQSPATTACPASSLGHRTRSARHHRPFFQRLSLAKDGFGFMTQPNASSCGAQVCCTPTCARRAAASTGKGPGPSRPRRTLFYAASRPRRSACRCQRRSSGVLPDFKRNRKLPASSWPTTSRRWGARLKRCNTSRGGRETERWNTGDHTVRGARLSVHAVTGPGAANWKHC